MKIVAFFNKKGDVGKTTLVYHLAWMFAEMGLNVLVADLDPQSNLTSMFLDEERLIELWPVGSHPQTIRGVVDPIICGTGDIQSPHVEPIDRRIGLIPGDFELSGFEDCLSEAWFSPDQSAFHPLTAFYRALRAASSGMAADLVLVDSGSNLGAINRSALIASEHVVIPLVPDLFSLQRLSNLRRTLLAWRNNWSEMNGKYPDPDLAMPLGNMSPAGCVLMQDTSRAHLPVSDFPTCLASLKTYHSLMPMASEARKPMFALKPADGAIGAHGEAVQDCHRDFKALANQILKTIGAA